MGLTSWMAELFGLRKPARGTVARIIERGLVGRPLPSVWDVARMADEGYRRNVLIWACVKLRMKSAAQVKLVAKAPNRNGDLEPLKPAHPLQVLLARPNAEQSQREWIKRAFLHLDVGGNVFVHKVRSRAGKLVELWLLRPDKVAVVPDEMGFVQSYEFPTDEKHLAQRAGLIRSTDMIHYREDDYLDEYYGLSKIAVLARQGDVDNESAEYMRSVLLNSGMPANAIKIKSEVPLTPEHKDSLADQWRQKYGRRRTSSQWIGQNEFASPNVGSWGDIAIFDADVDYIKMGFAFSELDLNGIFQHTETRICSAFGVPPSSVGAKAGLDRNTFQNAEQTDDWFWNNTMVPEVMDFAEKLTAELAPEYGEEIVIEPDFSAVRALQEDQDARADRSLKGWEAGVVQFDELRIDLGKDAIGEGALVLDEESGEEIKELGKKYKWQLPQPKPAELQSGDEEEDDEESVDGESEEMEEQRLLPPPRLQLAAGKRPAWRRLHDAADEKSLSIRRSVSKGFRLAKEGVEVQALANALFVYDGMKAEELALRAFREHGVPVIRKTMCSALASLYRAGARVGARDTVRRHGTGPTEKNAGPELDPGEDAGFAETRVGELVTDVSEATRTLIRQSVEGMFEDGYSARRAANRIRDAIGLTKQGLRRLEKFERAQIAKGVAGPALEQKVSRFARKLIRARALVIARWEGIRAVSEGQSSIWKKAVERGILPAEQLQFWITTEDERTCTICAPMDGQERTIRERFETGDGALVDGPPVHPECRCARGLR